METRYELTFMATSESKKFDWLKFLDEQYKTENITKNPKQLLKQFMMLYSSSINNTTKSEQLKSLISDVLVLNPDEDLMEALEEIYIDPIHKKQVLDASKEENLYFYRFVIRALINAPQMAKEYLELDRDEELEAVHHLELDKSAQIMFELGLWHSIIGNISESAFFFQEISKSLPVDYVPTESLSKVTALTRARIDAYLGVTTEPMETEPDESYVRELYHYCKEIDGNPRRNRTPSEYAQEAQIYQCNQENLILMATQTGQPKTMIQRFETARSYLKEAILTKNKGYASIARESYESLLHETAADPESWSECIFACASITPLEQSVDDSYFNTLSSIVEKCGFPRKMKIWIFIVGLNVRSQHIRNFLEMLPEGCPFADINHLTVCLISIAQGEAEMSEDRLLPLVMQFLDIVSRIKDKYIQYYLDTLSAYTDTFFRILFTVLRSLKVSRRNHELEGQMSHHDLISFTSSFILNLSNDGEYRLRSKFSDFRKLVKLAELAARKCVKNSWMKEALGNLKFLGDKYKDATKLFLAAARENPDVKLLQRLIYCVAKSDALQEAQILAQFQPNPLWFEFSVPFKDALIPYLVDINLIENLIEKHKKFTEKREKLLGVIQQRHQYAKNRNSLIDQLRMKFVDLLYHSCSKYEISQQFLLVNKQLQFHFEKYEKGQQAFVNCRYNLKMDSRIQIDEYYLHSVIGEGTTSTVYQSFDSIRKRWSAVKLFKSGQYHNFSNELKFLISVPKHSNILECYGIQETGTVIDHGSGKWRSQVPFLAYEVAEKGDLFTHLIRYGPPSNAIAKSLSIQWLDAVETIHDAGFFHGDLKPENILIASDGKLKISDFGLSGHVTDKITVPRGTVAYMTPEQINKNYYSGISDDLFAVAIIIFILAIGRPPFAMAQQSDFHYRWVAAGKWDEFWQEQRREIPAELKSWVEQTLGYDVESRITLQQMRDHPWLAGERASEEEIAEFFETL